MVGGSLRRDRYGMILGWVSCLFLPKIQNKSLYCAGAIAISICTFHVPPLHNTTVLTLGCGSLTAGVQFCKHVQQSYSPSVWDCESMWCTNNFSMATHYNGPQRIHSTTIALVAEDMLSVLRPFFYTTSTSYIANILKTWYIIITVACFNTESTSHNNQIG